MLFQPLRRLTISRTLVAAMLGPVHWMARGLAMALAMCVAVLLAGTLILMEQNVARNRHVLA